MTPPRLRLPYSPALMDMRGGNLARKKEETKRLFHCGHCGTNLRKTTFYQHKRMFFDTKNKVWSKTRVYSEQPRPKRFCLEDQDPVSDDSLSGPSWIDKDETDSGMVYTVQSFDHCHMIVICFSRRS